MSVSPPAPAWDAIANQIRPYVRRRVAAEQDADDVLQDVLLKMYRALPTLRDETRLAPWMYRIARAAIVDHLRKKAPAGVMHSTEEPSSPAASEEDDVEQQLSQQLASFVRALPEPYREAITMIELEGLSQVRAAARLGISVSGMKSRVQRGRAKLKAMLETCCQIAVDARGRVIECEPRSGKVPPGCCN